MALTMEAFQMQRESEGAEKASDDRGEGRGKPPEVRPPKPEPVRPPKPSAV